MNEVTEKYLNIVGKGFTFNQNEDLFMVQDTNKFLDSLSMQELVELIDGLDVVLQGKQTIKRRN